MAETGLSARELATLDMDEYAKVTRTAPPLVRLPRRRTPTRPQSHPGSRPPCPCSSPHPPSRASTLTVPITSTRGALTAPVGGEGVGIFDSVDSRSDAYAAAVRAQAGRGALSNANVTEGPRLTGRYPDQDAQRDTRTAAQRFATPGNSWQGR